MASNLEQPTTKSRASYCSRSEFSHFGFTWKRSVYQCSKYGHLKEDCRNVDTICPDCFDSHAKKDCKTQSGLLITPLTAENVISLK